MSGYRSEEEALRHRVEVLEEELAEAKHTIAKLKGEGEDEAPKSRGLAPGTVEQDSPTPWYLGRPRELVLTKNIDVAPTDETLVNVSDHLRLRLTYGQISQVGRQLMYRNGMHEVTLTGEDDGARLRLRSNQTQLASLLIAGVAILPSIFLPLVGALMGPGHLLWAMPLAAVLGFLIGRFFIGVIADRQRTKLTQVFDEVARIAAKKPKPKRVRVVAPAPAKVEEPLEAETEKATDQTSRV